MSPFTLHRIRRRQFLRTASGLAAGVLSARFAGADETPRNTNPRAISGDPVEPDWRERLTITVGPGQSDFAGTTDRVIQAAVDYVARLGGGTVRILPGIYRLRNSVFLQSRVRLQGSGADSVLIKEPSVATKLTVDGDHWDQEVTLADPGGFQVGDGVRLVAKDPFGRGTSIIQRTLVAASGHRFKLDRRLEERFHLAGDPAIATNFALLQGTHVADVVVENLTIDGNKTRNAMVDRGKFDDGSIRLDGCNRITVREVTVRNFYCDGIVWGISHDVRVEQCVLHDGARFGLHPGSGSQRSILRGNRVQRSRQGVYFCWGAQHGLIEQNAIEDCSYGMTIGHRDSDNLIRDNDVRRSGVAGIHFRPVASDSKAFAPHRNRIEQNRISDSGPENGVAIDITAGVEAVTISGNELRETRRPLARVGIRIGADTRDIRCRDNRIEGFAAEVSDLRKE
ncbi:MAG: right-handed parallel beta-helix repeat-containing protein [Verrucomicrobia bacterium]|nr:right-handed parallel beta-helix repeat-containing protein [Verrucomicrobiota bacterium]